MMIELFVLMAIFAGLPQISGDPTIKVYDAMRAELPVDVYVNKTTTCPSEAERIFAQLEKAFEIHRQAVLRFLTEIGTRYDDLLKVQFRLTSDIRSADVIFGVKDLPPPTAGAAGITGDMLPHEVVIDCDLGKTNIPNESRIGIILHELYHTLGLGHTYACDQPADLMCPFDVGNFYPSTLNLLAIHYRYFVNPALKGVITYTLPKDIPYVVVLPWTVTVTQFYSQMASLREQIDKLTFRLDNDIAFISNEVRKINRAVDNLWSSHIRLENEVKNLTAVTHNIEDRMANLEASQKSIDVGLETLRAKLELLEAEVKKTRSTLFELLTMMFVMGILLVSVSVIALRSIRVRRS